MSHADLDEELRKMKIGFVGLGRMGKPMAMNLLKSGAELIVNHPSAESFPEFEKKKARGTSDLMELARVDTIFLSLQNDQAVRDVLFGEKGMNDHLRPGQIVVDPGTTSHATTMDIAKSLEERAIAFLDAPVSGMEARAVNGTLTVMCGGKQEIFNVIKPYLECIGNNILYMGGIGSGQLTKLINQLLFDINVAALAEILPLAVKMGLDPEKVAEVVNNSTGKSYASEFFIPRILEGNFSAGYPMKHPYKDLVNAAEISARLCIPMPVLQAAMTTYQMALLEGHGDSDKGAMICVFEELLGVKYRIPSVRTDPVTAESRKV
jgi:3-hydroxyisobutyrate dehydrogenase-like beta-hydroxyacid dehydrogenase